MKIDLSKKTHLLLVCIGVAIVASTAWRHRNAQWVQQLLQVEGPAKVNIKLDNGSVRDVQPRVTSEQPSKLKNEPSSDNAIGKLKKCLLKDEVIYTDQPCPLDARVAPVKGGSVNVIGAAKATGENTNAAESGPKTLRDALDLSGNENIREKMMERAINQ